MAIYELWLERTMEGKYIAHFDRIPPEKNRSSYATTEMESSLAAAQTLRNELRKWLGADDQFRVRPRTNIYENLNEALEDMLRA